MGKGSRHPSSGGRKPRARALALQRDIASLLAIGAAGIVVYLNSFRGIFLFDDVRAIVENQSIRRLWPISDHFAGGLRPLVNVSLALNYAVSELDTWSYHGFNLAIHILAALTLFGLVRRTLRLKELRPEFGGTAHWLALAASLIWTVHPLLTEAVTYVIHRAESMMALCYLLTLYCALRGAKSRRRAWWYGGAVAACAAGMATKSITVTAPVIVLLYDRLFLSPSVGRALRRRWPLYALLAASWLILVATGAVAYLVGPHPGVTTAGLSYSNFGPLAYALTQPGVILHYLRLAVWPHPLCLDYVWPVATTPGAVVVPAVAVLALLALTGWAVWRVKPVGFLGAFFFLVLSPTSSLIPIQDPAAERRMYLPLCAVVVLLVLAGYRIARALFRGWAWSARKQQVAAVLLATVVLVALGYGTIRRNRDYHSNLAMWSSVVAVAPENDRALDGLGIALLERGDVDGAIRAHERSLAIAPNRVATHINLAVALEAKGDRARAIDQLRKAVAIAPHTAEAHYNLGRLYDIQGRAAEAMRHYERAIAIRPSYAYAHTNLANILSRQGRTAEAIEHYQLALRADPRLVQARDGLLRARSRRAGRPQTAVSGLTPAQRHAMAQALSDKDQGPIWFATYKSDAKAAALQTDIASVFRAAGWTVVGDEALSFSVKPGVYLLVAGTEAPRSANAVKAALQSAGLEVTLGTGYRAYYAEKKRQSPSWQGVALAREQTYVVVIGRQR